MENGDEVSTEGAVSRQKPSSYNETTIVSVWVDKVWFQESGGQMKPARGDVCDAD